jgi:alkylation response protein AidB-like acyl-CoA dehydrogenase
MQIYEGTSHIQRIVIARDLVGREERATKEG